MRFQRIAPNIYTGLHRSDPVVHDQSDRHFTHAHSHHLAETYRRICDSSPEPKTKKVEKNNRQDKREQRQRRDADKIKRFHIAAKTIGSETARKDLIRQAVGLAKDYVEFHFYVAWRKSGAVSKTP